MTRAEERARRDQQRQHLLDKIKFAREEVAAAEELVTEAIAEARMYGVTWDRIATLFPVSRSTLVRIYDPEAYSEEDRRDTTAEVRAINARRGKV